MRRYSGIRTINRLIRSDEGTKCSAETVHQIEKLVEPDLHASRTMPQEANRKMTNGKQAKRKMTHGKQANKKMTNGKQAQQ